MSGAVVGWAFKQDDLTPTEKLILVALADNCDDTGRCWPGRKHLVTKTGLGRSTVYRTLDQLRDKDVLHVEDWNGRDAYQLNLSRSGTVPERENPVPERDEKSQSGTPIYRRTVNEPSEETSDTSPSDEQKLWDAYVAKVKPKRAAAEIPPSHRRTATKALKEYALDDLIRAIDGFLSWRRKKEGDRSFSAIFATGPHTKPLYDHIGFWIECAGGMSQSGGGASPLDRVPSVEAAKLRRAIRNVQRGHRSQNADTVQQAQQDMAYLNSVLPSYDLKVGHRDDGLPMIVPVESE